MPLPEWISPLSPERPGHYVIDPDLAYPSLISRLRQMAAAFADDPDNAERDLSQAFDRAGAAIQQIVDQSKIGAVDYWQALAADLNQFSLELIYQIVKLDVRSAIAAADVFPALVVDVRADDGRKDRWRLSDRPLGPPMPSNMQDRARLVRAVYRRLRGFVPN